MCSNDAAIERSRGPRRLNAVVAGLVGLLGAVLLSGMFEVSLPTPARAEVAAVPVAGLCFHGPGASFSTSPPPGGAAANGRRSSRQRAACVSC